MESPTYLGAQVVIEGIVITNHGSFTVHDTRDSNDAFSPLLSFLILIAYMLPLCLCM